MPNYRQTLGLVSFTTFVYYLVFYLRNYQPHSLLLNASHDGLERSSRIVAVGDLHGDIENAQKVLEMAGVVDSNGRWSGKVDVFVQTGDIVDRYAPRYSFPVFLTRWSSGDDTIQLFDWMEELRSQALGAGGQVLSHLGNHEWMNAIGQ
jgi:hypothetical protein